MKNIKLASITKFFHGEPIVENLSLVIPSGTFFALLGPSGSGKTTLLRLIAGFERPDHGRIYLGEEDITELPINERRINTVFQNYALFPHMNVFDNVAYGLKIRGVPLAEREQKVVKILKTVHLEKHMYKPIQQLSGGQQQRVALARAIVNEPEVLLLDEPLAALDLKLRERMLLELVELQRVIKTTFIYVTHDQIEALTLAGQMAIMNADGEIEQTGSPEEIYEFPASSFVAQFVGTTNLFHGTLQINPDKASYIFEVENLGKFEIAAIKPLSAIKDKASAFMSLRPEKIEISTLPLTGFSNHLPGVVESIIYQGRSTQYNVRLTNNFVIHVFKQNEEHFPQERIKYNDEVYIYWQKENIVLLER